MNFNYYFLEYFYQLVHVFTLYNSFIKQFNSHLRTIGLNNYIKKFFVVLTFVLSSLNHSLCSTFHVPCLFSFFI